MQAPIIYVDADACPVKNEVLRLADRAGVETFLVANSGLRPSRDPMVHIKIVPQGADAADDWIVEQARENDLVVTADVPLAARVVAKGAHAMGPTGRRFTRDDVGMALAMRDLKRDLREAGQISEHHASFSNRHRASFTDSFARMLQEALRAAQ